LLCMSGWTRGGRVSGGGGVVGVGDLLCILGQRRFLLGEQ
jgi:hypothetical protein